MNPIRLLAVFLLVAPGAMFAQAPVTFDVVAIRPHAMTGNDPSERRILPGGRFVAKATSVRTLLRISMGIDDNRMAGAIPGWVDSELYDIDATTADRADVKTPEQFQGLLRSLLVERFGFKFHRDQKEGPIYRLEVDKPGKLGPALKVSAPDAVPNMSDNTNSARTQMRVTKMSMVDIAAGLRRKAGRPVEDHTDLKGNYDFEIEWSPEQTPDATFPSLFTVLKEQLGLKLQSAKGPIEVLVIDAIDRPSEN